jgi:hypothetical protein
MTRVTSICKGSEDVWEKGVENIWPEGQKQPRTSEKYTRALKFVFVASITEVDQTEKNWYMGHVKCKGKRGKVRKSQWISVYMRPRCKETDNIAIIAEKLRGLTWTRFVWFFLSSRSVTEFFKFFKFPKSSPSLLSNCSWRLYFLLAVVMILTQNFSSPLL